MNLIKYKFPELTKFDEVFSTLPTDKKLLSEAMARGFYEGDTEYNDTFNKIFFNTEGMKVTFKPGVDRVFLEKAWKYCKCLMKSFEPKQQEKEAVCAMLMSELILPIK